jgi:hypothetical protein
MKNIRKKIHVKVEKTATGFSACTEREAVFTTAEHTAELYVHLIEGLNLFYEEEEVYVTKENLKLSFDLKQFFQYYRVLNANFLAERIGMNPTLLSQYVRGVKIPSEKQTEKIIQGIRAIGKELADLDLR